MRFENFMVVEVHIVAMWVMTHLCLWDLNLCSTNVVFKASGVWDVVLCCMSKSRHLKGCDVLIFVVKQSKNMDPEDECTTQTTCPVPQQTF